MRYLILSVLIFLAGCSNQGLVDSEVPKILGVSIETNYLCKKGGTEVPCLLRSLPSDVISVDVRITGSDDIGVAGYYIISVDSLVPANWTIIAPAETSFDHVIKFDLPPGDGIKRIRVGIKDMAGKISESTTASVLVVSGQIKEWGNESISDSGGVSGPEDAGRYNSIAMDADGNIHVSYLGGGELRYAENTTGTWRVAVVDGGGFAGEYSSIAVDSAGSIHIGYYDNGSHGVKYATCKVNCDKSENWTSAFLEKGLTSVSFSYVSLVVDTDDSPHISYYDIAEGSLKYAYCNADCTVKNIEGIGDNWKKIFVDKGVTIDNKVNSDVGQYSSIAIDRSDKSVNKIYISYFESIGGSLKIAECDSNCTEDSAGDGIGKNWKTNLVDKGEFDIVFQSTKPRGRFTSVKVDNDGYVHISYFYETNGDLKYATNKNPLIGDWVTATVDNYDWSGLSTSLAIGPDNKVYIAYYQYASGISMLKYAVCTSSCIADTRDNFKPEGDSDGVADNWNTYILAMFDGSGMFASIIVDSYIHVTYYNIDTGVLNYTFGK